MSLSVLSVPVICSAISSYVDINSFPHLQGLKLADGNISGDRRVDILIGADYYHRIVLGEVRKGSSGPVATNSKIGWLLSGLVSCNDSNSNSFSSFNAISRLCLDALPSHAEVYD